MKENATCIAKNRSASILVYTVDNIRREFQPGESKKVPFAELEKLSYKRGGARILQDYLMIKEDEAIQELGIHVEPEYKMSKEDVIELINNGSQDAWLDCLDFAPEGVLDMVKQLSVSIPLLAIISIGIQPSNISFFSNSCSVTTSAFTSSFQNFSYSSLFIGKLI